MDPLKDLYVRAFLLCSKIEEERGMTTLRRLIGRRSIPTEMDPILEILDISALIVIERNGDRSPLRSGMRLLDPQGRPVEWATAPLPDPGDVNCAVFMVEPLELRIPLPRPGIYRIVLDLNGRPAAFAPLELHVVDGHGPGRSGNRRVH